MKVAWFGKTNKQMQRERERERGMGDEWEGDGGKEPENECK